MNETQEKLLNILSSALFEGTNCDSADPDVYEEAGKQAVLAFVDRRAARQVISQNIQVLYAHQELCNLMREHNIPCTTIKGYASSWYYPEPIRRSLGDVDFLIPLESREQASQLLQANGYVLTESTNPHHWGYKKDSVDYELHWRLNGAPEGELGKHIDSYMQDVWQAARLVQINGLELQIPSDFHNGLIMILHIASHMTLSGMGLRHLCDWAVFVDRVGDFESMFRHCFEELGLWHFACVLTQVCVKYLHLPAKEWADGADIPQDVLDATIDYILYDGNFGMRSRSYASVFLSYLTVDGSLGKHGRVYNLFRFLNKTAFYYVPITKKIPLLLPIGWFYVVLQYLVRVCKGKRKLANPFQSMSIADSKSSLFSEYRIFEK